MATPKTLREEIVVQMEKLEQTVNHLEELQDDLGDSAPKPYHVAGAGHMLGSL